MARLLAACAASLLLYAVVFGFCLDRPLSTGLLRERIEAPLARAAQLSEPKLVILAGSNGPYSHRCQTIEPLIGIPCLNGGVAVGIGLDYLFARWKPHLHAGDIVYLPLEEAQYVRPRVATITGPDAAILLRHDRATLAALEPDRWAAAALAVNPRDAVMSVLETVLLVAGFHDPRAAVVGETNAWGDHIGHTEALAATNAAHLATASPYHPMPDAIVAGDGTRQVVSFLDWARANRVRVIGGLPVGFADSPIPAKSEAAIRAVYASVGWLPVPGRYPRRSFFDTADHLSEPWQIAHSRMVGIALRSVLTDSALLRP